MLLRQDKRKKQMEWEAREERLEFVTRESDEHLDEREGEGMNEWVWVIFSVLCIMGV
ncbi:hypothetical protein ACQKMZ_15600 [Bacillus paramycoides]|uniref:hypothetical protein n=1 Tax=Bacillus paramycoides TaxID=2026194 RepID=UPI003D03426B